VAQLQSRLGVPGLWHPQSECHLQLRVLYSNTCAVFFWLILVVWRWKTDGSNCHSRQSVDMQCQTHTVTGDHTSLEPCNTSCNPSWVSPERRQQLCVVVCRCKQMFMGDWLVISQVISFMVCIKLEWRTLSGKQSTFIYCLSECFENLCTFLSFWRYDCTVYSRLSTLERERILKIT
jgi:hypothetical protein